MNTWKCVVLIVLALSFSAASGQSGAILLRATAALGEGPAAENSGIVASRAHPDVFWMHNDSGDEARVYAVRRDGSVYESSRYPDVPGVLLGGAINCDWEDIAIDASGRLIVGDIGNNSNARADLVLYRFAEPEPAAGRTSAAEVIRFRYPDQRSRPASREDFNFDAEGMFTVGDTVYILSKNRSDTFTKLYRLDETRGDAVNVLTYVDRFDVRGRATGADASADGLRLAVLTYERVWVFERRSLDEPFFGGRVLMREYRLADAPDEESDSEAICFAGDHLIIADESRGKLYEMPLSALEQVRAARAMRSADDGPTLDVMGFNIRYGSAGDGKNAWMNRREILLRAIERDLPDVLMTQETLSEQRVWLSARLDGFDAHGVGRDDGRELGEQMTIWYDRARFTKLEGGHFWLSETPSVPGSSSWDSACNRMASWLRLYDNEGGRAVVVCSTHLDHRSEEARRNGCAVLRRELARIADGDPVVLAGDFNTPDTHERFERLQRGEGVGFELVSTFRTVFPERDEDEATFSGWNGRISGGRIDWILVSPEFDVVGASIDRFQVGGRYPSDHYPVRAVVRYSAGSRSQLSAQSLAVCPGTHTLSASPLGVGTR